MNSRTESRALLLALVVAAAGLLLFLLVRIFLPLVANLLLGVGAELPTPSESALLLFGFVVALMLLRRLRSRRSH